MIGKYRAKLDEHEETVAREQIIVRPSLATFAQVRSWTVISKTRAWSNSLIGKKSHRFLEPYVNDKDRKGVVLKFRARTDTIQWGIALAKLHSRASMEVCNICNTGSRQTVEHVIMECKGMEQHREIMFARLREYMTQSSNSLSFETFMKMDVDQQFFLLLGRSTGSVELDQAIDLSIRIFLKTADRLISETGFPSY